LVDRVGSVEESDVAGADGAIFRQRVEVQHLVPVARAEEHDGHAFLHLARLPQGEHLEELVEGAEAAGEQHDRLREIYEPELAHEKIVEMKVQLATDIRIVELLRDRYGQADIESLRLRGAAVRCLHDTGATAGADDKAALIVVELLRPTGQSIG